MNEAKRQLKDSGTRRQWKTGAVRDGAEGKGRFDLLQTHAIFRLATVNEKGAVKYAPRNWEKGIPLSKFLDSGMRHLNQVIAGETDEDHPAQALWNIASYIQTKYWIDQGILPKELDDMPQRKPYELERTRRSNSRKTRRKGGVRKTRRRVHRKNTR